MYCIFQMHDSTEDFGAWSDVQWSSSDSEYSRYRLQPPEFQSRQLRRLLKVFGSLCSLIPLTKLISFVLLLQVHSEEAEQSMRPCVAKSYSFGGYGGGVSILTRGDSVISTHSAPGSRPLTKQGLSVEFKQKEEFCNWIVDGLCQIQEPVQCRGVSAPRVPVTSLSRKCPNRSRPVQHPLLTFLEMITRAPIL